MSNPTARPDIIIILTDEERAPTATEVADATVARWRRNTLAAERWFADHGVSFKRHYTGAVACVPSRPTLFTGHYPDVHGVTQTDGLGKSADEGRMRWLRAGEVPTLGHWLRSAGYDTHYDGKWHITHADLHHPDGTRVVTNTADGTVLADGVAAYLDADPLDAFGFSGWVGPEPHGGDPADAGLCRDPLVAARVTAWLTDRYRRRLAGDPDAARPFMCVASFVNPHDIVLFPGWLRNDDSPLATDRFATPDVPASPTATEDLSTKPAVQAAYRDTYPTGYGPAEVVGPMYADNADTYRRTYLRLHAEVDGPVEQVRATVCDAAAGGAAPAGTVMVRTADHGDLLGAHGGLHQKWFTLYDEAVRVPFTVVCLDGTGAPGAPARIDDTPTSHVDVLPTLLDAAGIDRAAVAAGLARDFTEVHELPGASLWPLATTGTGDPSRRAYLQTRDNILEGDDGRGVVARILDVTEPPPNLLVAVCGAVPTNVEAVVARVTDHDAPGGSGHLWKLVRTFDDPACWTEPHVRQLATSGPDGVTWRTDVLADQWELYDLDTDPAEATNLAGGHGGSTNAVFGHLQAVLNDERARRLPARTTPWPYQSGHPRVWASANQEV